MTIADLARRAGRLAINNSPTILTSIGVVGAITTAYLAGKASFEAADVIRREEDHDFRSEEDRREPREIIKDRVELVWKLYIPAAGMCVATVACIIGANHIGSRRAAGLAAATTILERSFEEYKTKVIEKFGEKKEQQVRDEIVQDRVTASYNEDLKLFGVSEGELCYDKFSDRYFLGSVEGINAAINSFNNIMNHDGYASLAELYRLLEIEAASFSENIGWNHDRLLEPRISSALAHGSRPVIVMDFSHDPSPDYGRFR
jgi:hypothetical protein